MCHTHMFLGLLYGASYLLSKTALCNSGHNYHSPLQAQTLRVTEIASHDSHKIKSFLGTVQPMSVEPRMV